MDLIGRDMVVESMHFLREKSPRRGLKRMEKEGRELELERERRLNSAVIVMGAAVGDPRAPTPVRRERVKGFNGSLGR